MTYQEAEIHLSNILEGDVTTNKDDLESHSTDWSLFKITPQMVVYPKNEEDIKKLVLFVNQENSKGSNFSLTPRAAGSGMTGGSLNDSIILDITRYLNNFYEITKGDYGTQEHHKGFPYKIEGLAVSQPGISYIDFERETVKHNLIMPVFPASRKLCAIGGMVANNGAGEKSLKYGQNRDFVHSLEVILSDGNMYHVKQVNFSQLEEIMLEDSEFGKVSRETYALIKENWEIIQEKRPKTAKNAAGYLIWDVISADSIESFEAGNGYFDLTKLFVGSQGTTGIITKIEYKLVKQEEKEALIVMFVDDIQQLPQIVTVLNKYDLETIELYDDNTFKIGVKFFKDFIKDKGFFSAMKYSIRFLPEFWMALTGGVPKFVVLAESVDSSGFTLEKEVKAELNDLKREIPGLKSFIVKGEKNAQKYWDFRHDSFKLLTEHSLKTRKTGQGTRTAPFIDDIAVDPKYLPEYIPKLVQILDEYKDEFMYTIAGHLGNGNFHIIPLVDMNKEENKDKIVEISEKVYDLALSLGGSITAEHNDGIVRTPFLPQMFGEEMMLVFKEIKNIFDPNNIFNPGKKIGLTKEDIRKYLA